MLMEKAVQVARRAMEFLSQFRGGKAHDVLDQQLLQHLDHVLIRAADPAPLVAGIFKLDGQDRGDDPEQLAAVVQVVLWWRGGEEAMAFLGQRVGSGVQPGGPEDFGEFLQQREFRAPKQRVEMFQAEGKVRKDQFPAVRGTDSATLRLRENENVAGRQRMFDRRGDERSEAPLRKQQREALASIEPFLKGGEADKPQREIIAGGQGHGDAGTLGHWDKAEKQKVESRNGTTGPRDSGTQGLRDAGGM